MPHDMDDVLQEVEEVLHDLHEGLSEEALITHSRHKKLEHWILLLRNGAVLLAAVLFVVSMLHAPSANICKAAAYFLGAMAYFCEIMILTDCLTKKVPHREMFMAYCFGPLYLLLGISYLLH